jgi:hypothetical protein
MTSKSSTRGVFERLATAQKSGGSLRLFYVHGDNGGSRALIRSLSAKIEVNYPDFELARSHDGQVREIDLYQFTSGERISKTLRSIYLAAIGAKPILRGGHYIRLGIANGQKMFGDMTRSLSEYEATFHESLEGTEAAPEYAAFAEYKKVHEPSWQELTTQLRASRWHSSRLMNRKPALLAAVWNTRGRGDT